MAFESDSYSGIEYKEMVVNCNETIRSGHPGLPQSIESEPVLDELRCEEAVDDWQETKLEEAAQQESNRRAYRELTAPASTEDDV